MNNKRNLILIALVFVAILSACIIITLQENRALEGNSSGNVLSSVTSQLPSSAVLSSANITSSSSSAASSLNNTYVERYLIYFKADNKNYEFFDFALSTCPFSKNMIEAAASYYCDKKKPKPMVVVMSQYGLSEINLTDDSADYTFAEEGKVKIIGKNELIISIVNTTTKEIFDCDVTYSCINHGQSSSSNMNQIKRASSTLPTI